MGTEDDYGLGALNESIRKANRRAAEREPIVITPAAPNAAPARPERNGGASAAKALSFSLFDDLGQSAKKDMLVEGLLGTGEASSFFGEPGSGKSVLAEDLGLHVSAGREWHGRRVKQGAVLFLALERAALVKRRAIAFRLHTGLTGLPFAIFAGELDFRDVRTADRVAETAKALEDKTGIAVVLTILDTVSRALCGGDENSPKDMGALVRTIGRTIELTGAHFLGVHHSPVDGGNRQRGHSSLKGALDTTIHVAKVGASRTATVTKANDSEEGDAIGFTLQSIDIDRDEIGNLTTAPIVVPTDGGGSARPRELPRGQRMALRALAEALLASGRKPAPAAPAPASVTVVTIAEWRERSYHMGISGADTNEARQKAFKRAYVELLALGRIGVWDEQVWLVGTAEA